MDERKHETDPAAAAAARRAATTSGSTPTASRGSSTASSNSNSNPAASTGTPPTAVVQWAGDSCYYPRCRKDANCDCDMCLASIDATRDLVRAPEAASARRFFAAKDRRGRSALFAGEPWTPPPMRSTAKSSRRAPPAPEAAPAGLRRGAKGGRGGVSHDWALYAATVLGILILLWVDTGLVPEAAARGFGPKLSPEAVTLVGAEARLAPGGLENKLRVLERRAGQLVAGGGDRVTNCSSQDSAWRFYQVCNS
jgi:hypothetical protein